ncbi:MAG: ABC transporter substrate-binding protein [Alphaproteobacteria bacterium]|nr:ABC transporter substrate-binding protein [Alphaproteobacteria bacterium]
MLPRRPIGRLALIATFLGALAALPAAAQDKPLKKVRLAVGTSFLNVGYPMNTLPVTLGYWKTEGYDVEVIPAGASLQVLQQMVGGNAEFGQVNASVIVQANAKNDVPARIVMGNGVIDWSIAVDADGPIKSVKDLKGKTIGVFSLATGGVAYFNKLLRENSLDPAKDVDLVPLGLGAPPVEALKSGKVQGLLYWAAAVAVFENAGLKLRKLMGEDWRQYPDYSFTTMQSTIDKDPAMVIAIARGVAKATVYALANPDCARKLHWQHYPATKPSGADEATLIKWDLNAQQAQLDSLADGFKLGGGKLWGAADPAAYDRLIKFMLDAKLIDKPITAQSMIINIPGFFEKINDFDVKAIEADAKACKS